MIEFNKNYKIKANSFYDKDNLKFIRVVERWGMNGRKGVYKITLHERKNGIMKKWDIIDIETIKNSIELVK